MLTATINGDELIINGQVAVGDVYHGACCAGYDFEVALIMESIWGICANPDCPHTDNEGHYKNVRNLCIEDLGEAIAE